MRIKPISGVVAQDFTIASSLQTAQQMLDIEAPGPARRTIQTASRRFRQSQHQIIRRQGLPGKAKAFASQTLQ